MLVLWKFENLLIKDKSFTIHHQNIQLLAIEKYKSIHNLPGGNLSEFFDGDQQTAPVDYAKTA